MKNGFLRVGLTLGLLGLVFGAMTALAASKTSDAKMQTQAQDRLFHAKVGERVTVKVEDGAATLEGTVESVGRKLRAAKEVQKVDGITRLDDRIQVGAGGTTDSQILAEASRQIRRYVYYSIFDLIELKVQAGQLTLAGQVLYPWRREDLGRIVEMVPGVRGVENTVEVLPLSPMDNEVRARVARAIYGDPVLWRYGIQANPPIHIVVKNGNVTLSGVVNTALEKAVAERAAHFAATFFGLDNQLQVEKETKTRT